MPATHQMKDRMIADARLSNDRWAEEALRLRAALICARLWMHRSRESITDEHEKISFDYAMDMVNSAITGNTD